MLCLSGAALGSYLLYRDMTDTGMSGQGTPVAQILRAEKRVKRKLASSYVWNTVQADQPLFHRESVQTGPESAALIRLADGATVEVRENSLVVIDETKTLMSNFLRGSLILHQESGDSVMTSEGDGKIQVRELPVRLISPSMSETFFTAKGDSEKVHFEWKARSATVLDGNAPITVQVSRDPSFQKPQALTEPDIKLSAGRYYWRAVRALEGNKEEAISAVAQFSVIEAIPITLTSPSADERVEFFGDRATIEFRWVDESTLGRQRSANVLANIDHELEIADDPRFQNVIASKKIAGNSGIARIKELPEGPLYWRIRSKWGRLSVTSAVLPFRTERATRTSIELLAPQNQAILPEGALRLSWKSNLQGPESRYAVQVESTTPGQKFSKTESTQAGGLSLRSLPPGAYHWKVKTLSKNQVTGESEWRDFTLTRGGVLTLKSPLLNQRILYWTDPAVFTFQWDPDLLVTPEGSTNIYQLELSRQADFKNIAARKRTKANSISSSEIVLKPGSYYWRLQVLDETGAVLKTSASSQFTYGIHPVLNAPASASPDSETIIKLLERDTDPLLSWSKVDGAAKYEVLVIRQVNGGKKLWLRQVTINTSISLTNASEGTYFWSVRAIDQINRPGETLSDRKLILEAGDLLAPPKTKTQEVQ